MTTRSRTTIATKPRAVSAQTSGETSENTLSSVSRRRRQVRRSLPSDHRTSRTGYADEAFRDDDAAAKEYSPSNDAHSSSPDPRRPTSRRDASRAVVRVRSDNVQAGCGRAVAVPGDRRTCRSGSVRKLTSGARWRPRSGPGGGPHPRRGLSREHADALGPLQSAEAG